MSVFVDTSAFFALLDASDERHEATKHAFGRLQRERLLTHSYVVVESEALVRRRFGAGAARDLLEKTLPVVAIVWVDADLHRAGVTAILSAGSRRVSLVDCVSFELMRRERIDAAFAFDRHFAEQGFTTIP